jgi:hypothetical protein
MISKFTKPLLFSSVLALGALGFVACSEDNGTNAGSPSGTSSSSFVPMSLPEETATTSIVFTDLGISSENLTRVKFKGSISIDLGDSETVDDVDAVRFTDVQFQIVSVNKTSTGNVTITNPIDYGSVAVINFAEMDLQTKLDDGYTECGNFYFIIAVTADDGVIKSVSKDTIPFVRPEEKCKVPESSSSSVAAVPGAPLDTVTINISTKTDKCIDLDNNLPIATTNGDICFTRTAGNAIRLSSGKSLKFATFDNLNDGSDFEARQNDFGKEWLPDNPTTDSFLYTEANLKETYDDFLSVDDMFFVAIAPTYVPNSGSAIGFYSFIVTQFSTPDANGDVNFSLLVYKAK